MQHHDLVQAIKSLALELGRTPTRAEFVAAGAGFDYKLRTMFGTYAVLIEAAGLEQNKPSKKTKITNQIFERDIERHLEQYKPVERKEKTKWPRIAVISDIHWPFENAPLIKAFIEFVAEFKPEYVVLNGDAWDLYSYSKYPRSHNLFTPKEEERLARERNEKFWRDVKLAAPKAECIQTLGNHEARPLKRVIESVPTMEHWVEKYFEDLFRFDGVRTILNAREEVRIADILIFHGYRSQLGAHRDYTLMNCINGHTHRGGAVFKQLRDEVIWELNSGVAGDPHSKGLSYMPQKIVEWTPGWGAVDEYGPRFIPFR